MLGVFLPLNFLLCSQNEIFVVSFIFFQVELFLRGNSCLHTLMFLFSAFHCIN